MTSLLRVVSENPIRQILQNSLLYLPLMSKLQMARATTGAMNEPTLMIDWAKQVAETITEHGGKLASSKLVEIGAGHSLGVASTLLMLGASRVTAIDVVKYADTQDLNPFKEIFEKGVEVNLFDREKAIDIDIEKVVEQIQYLIVDPRKNWPLENNSVDVVYSYFSGEHWQSVERLLAESNRVLKPGGLTMHAIDLRDHRNFEGNWLKFLYYDSWLWNAMSSKRGVWSNRLMPSEWHAKFAKFFEVLSFDQFRQSLPPDFDKTKLARHFRNFDMEEISVSHLWVVARKIRSF